MSTTDAHAQLRAEVLMDINMTTNRVPKIKSRHCPVLQDINCDIAYILSHSNDWSAEETISELIHSENVDELCQQIRLKIFSHAMGLLIDGKYPNSPDICDYKLGVVPKLVQAVAAEGIHTTTQITIQYNQ